MFAERNIKNVQRFQGNVHTRTIVSLYYSSDGKVNIVQ